MEATGKHSVKYVFCSVPSLIITGYSLLLTVCPLLSSVYCLLRTEYSVTCIQYCELSSVLTRRSNRPSTGGGVNLNRSRYLGIHKQKSACWSIPRSQTVFIQFKICIWYAENGNYEAFAVVHCGHFQLICANCECLTCKMGLVFILLGL